MQPTKMSFTILEELVLKIAKLYNSKPHINCAISGDKWNGTFYGFRLDVLPATESSLSKH